MEGRLSRGRDFCGRPQPLGQATHMIWTSAGKKRRQVRNLKSKKKKKRKRKLKSENKPTPLPRALPVLTAGLHCVTRHPATLKTTQMPPVHMDLRKQKTDSDIQQCCNVGQVGVSSGRYYETVGVSSGRYYGTDGCVLRDVLWDRWACSQGGTVGQVGVSSGMCRE